MTIANSSRRISLRRQGALARRQSDLKTLGQLGPLSGKTEEDRKEIERKITVAQTDIENLKKKGVVSNRVES